MVEEIIKIVISIIIGGFLGYYIKNLFIKLNEKETRYFERKEQRYQKILNSLLKLYREKDKEKLLQIKKELLFESDFSWLYASDEVIKALNVFFDKLSSINFNKDKAMQSLAEIVILMRQDLGNKKTKLSLKDWHPRNPF